MLGASVSPVAISLSSKVEVAPSRARLGPAERERFAAKTRRNGRKWREDAPWADRPGSRERVWMCFAPRSGDWFASSRQVLSLAGAGAIEYLPFHVRRPSATVQG